MEEKNLKSRIKTETEKKIMIKDEDEDKRNVTMHSPQMIEFISYIEK